MGSLKRWEIEWSYFVRIALLLQEKRSLSADRAIFLKMLTFIFFPRIHKNSVERKLENAMNY